MKNLTHMHKLTQKFSRARRIELIQGISGMSRSKMMRNWAYTAHPCGNTLSLLDRPARHELLKAAYIHNVKVGVDDFASFIDQQRHVIQPVLFDKGPVRLGGIPADTQDFNFAGFIFVNVLLKLNKLRNSLFGVIFGVKVQHDVLAISEVRKTDRLIVLVNTGKCRCILTFC